MNALGALRLAYGGYRVMRWIMRFNRALSVYGFLVTWFESASADGKLSAAEIAEGVAGLIDHMGYGDRITVEPFNIPEE